MDHNPFSRSHCATMSSIRYTACQLLPHSCASRLAAATWRTLVDVGIAVRLPTKRGCRGGGRKQRTINPVIGHRPPTDRPHTRRNNNNLIQVPIVTQDSTVLVDKAKLCLINARSLRNKSLFVRNYVDECSLDTVALTETWLTDEDTTSVSELCRDNFTLIHQPRGGARRGGGIGVLFRKTLQLVSRVSVDTRASETLSVTLRNARTSCTTRVIVIYRPPNSCFGTFLDDVSTVLLIAGTHPTETVVCGDFNKKYGEPTCTDAVNLADLLDTAGFTQHVTGATHERGNTLDLVITAKTSHPIATAVKPTSLITDHYAVESELLLSKPSRLKRHITYRKQSAINNNIFAADLRSFNLNADEADPVVLLAAYDTCLRTTIDAHAPLVSRTITVDQRLRGTPTT